MIKKLSLQGIFNAAWQRFVVELKNPAYNDEDGCQYLAEDGSKCAVGCALPDDLITRIIEDKNNAAVFGTIVEKYPEYFDDQINGMNDEELEDFQYKLHDKLYEILGNARELKNIKAAYKEVAEKFLLKVPEDAND